MAAVLENFGGGPEGGADYLCLSQLAISDQAEYGPQLAAVQRAAWSQRYVAELGAATPAEIDRAFSDEAITRRMADMTAPAGRTTYLAAEQVGAGDGAEIVGFVRAARYEPLSPLSRAYPYIKDIDVHPVVGRQGIGGMLLDRVLAQFPDDRRVAIYTHSVNAPALDWYRRLGFFLRGDTVPATNLGTIELHQVHLEAPSVRGVRAMLLPSLVRMEYGPAPVDDQLVAANA